jgi:microcystin-dependent protein
MSEPFLAEILIVGFNFAPRGYAFCDGQILPINQNQSLYSLLGTTYGGDGRTTFALPDLRGRTPIHLDGTNPLGSKGGAEQVTLTEATIPSHSHTMDIATSDAANQPAGAGNVFATPSAAVGTIYSDTGAPPDTTLSGASISSTGGAQGHENMQPYLALNFAIALQGVFPSRN